MNIKSLIRIACALIIVILSIPMAVIGLLIIAISFPLAYCVFFLVEIINWIIDDDMTFKQAMANFMWDIKNGP